MLYMKAYQLTCNLILLDGMYEEIYEEWEKISLTLWDEEVIEYCEKFCGGGIIWSLQYKLEKVQI